MQRSVIIVTIVTKHGGIPSKEDVGVTCRIRLSPSSSCADEIQQRASPSRYVAPVVGFERLQSTEKVCEQDERCVVLILRCFAFCSTLRRRPEGVWGHKLAYAQNKRNSGQAAVHYM
eukprot:3534227-Amphidinium_carterae.2